MAIQISYPTAINVTLSDRVLGTQYDGETGATITKNFSVGSICNLALTEGVTGYFETSDLKGITVTNGLITKIEIIG